MGYSHGFKKDDDYRVCSCCGKKLPNTSEYFNYANKKENRLASICKKCKKRKRKN